MGRIKIEDRAATYHVFSRTTGRNFLFSDALAKETFVNLMKRVAIFTGCEVRTFCVLSNHFHVLVHVPVAEEITDQELLRRMSALYGKKDALARFSELMSKEGDARVAAREWITRRMYDISHFMQILKRSFSVWYNRMHARCGTLWEDRFHSVLVEDGSALLTMSLYIDLNPVRAGIVDDPKDYRFCSYAEACAGDLGARRALRYVEGTNYAGRTQMPWRVAHASYRKLLFMRGQESVGWVGKHGFDRKQVQKVLAAGGELSMGELLRCRVRYFTAGGILGSKAFIGEMLHARGGLVRDRFVHKMQGGDFGGMCSMRDLKKDVIV